MDGLILHKESGALVSDKESLTNAGHFVKKSQNIYYLFLFFALVLVPYSFFFSFPTPDLFS